MRELISKIKGAYTNHTDLEFSFLNIYDPLPYYKLPHSHTRS